MKKLTSILVALMMIAMVCCTAVAETATTWYLKSVEAQGMSMDAATIGMEMIFVLNADGTGAATLSMAGETDEQTCTWTEEGDQVTISIDGDPQVFTYDAEGNLVAEQDGMKMVLSSEAAPVAEKYVAAAPKADVTIADFDGTWICTMAETSGIQLPMDQLGMAMTIVLENGVGTMTIVQQDGTTTEGKMTGVLEQVAQEGGVAYSVLALTPDGETGSLQLVLQEDGKIAYTEPNSGVTFYFDLQVEEIAE